MDAYRANPTSGESFPGANFVAALDEYTKRVEASVTEIDTYTESTLTRIFALFIFLMLISAAFPLMFKLAEDLQSTFLYRGFLQTAGLFSVLAIVGLTTFTVYIRLIKLRRYRKNLETLLWPYERLLQKLSQMVDHGSLDEGTSTLIQLKILEGEVAYGRARRAIRSRLPFSFLLADREPHFRDQPEFKTDRDRFHNRNG